jgi:hypothetical protein
LTFIDRTVRSMLMRENPYDFVDEGEESAPAEPDD